MSTPEIKVLRGLEAVRRRPSLFLGDPETQGADWAHLLVGLVANAAADADANPDCKSVVVELFADGNVSVCEDGRGVSVSLRRRGAFQRPDVEIAMMQFHTGRAVPWISHVGPVVNALSEWLTLITCSNGTCYRAEYARGGYVSLLDETVTRRITRGTWLGFRPDPVVMPAYEWDAERLRSLVVQPVRVVERLGDNLTSS